MKMFKLLISLALSVAGVGVYANTYLPVNVVFTPPSANNFNISNASFKNGQIVNCGLNSAAIIKESQHSVNYSSSSYPVYKISGPAVFTVKPTECLSNGVSGLKSAVPQAYTQVSLDKGIITYKAGSAIFPVEVTIPREITIQRTVLGKVVEVNYPSYNNPTNCQITNSKLVCWYWKQ